MAALEFSVTERAKLCRIVNRNTKFQETNSPQPAIKLTSCRSFYSLVITLTQPSMQAIKLAYSWHAIYTRSRAEKKLYKELCSRNIECYLPLQKELRQWSDRTKWVEEPLLRSYLFVRVSEREYYDVINSSFAVRYVTFSGKAVSIPEEQIEALRIFLEDENRKVDLSYNELKKGESVEVVAGPLKGIQGEFMQIRGKNRIVIRFDSLGTCVYTDISLDKIKQVQAVF